MEVFTNERVLGCESIMVKEMRCVKSYPEHSHEFIEIVYIKSGEAREEIDGVSYNVSRGDIVFITPGTSHVFSSDDGFGHIEIFFSPKLLSDGMITPQNALSLFALSSFDDMRADRSGGRISFSGEERAEVEYILDAMLRECGSSQAQSSSILTNYLNILLIKMLRRTEDAEVLPDDIWQSLKVYIDSNHGERMSLTDLAAKCFYNSSYFSRVFKQKFGVSVTEYIRERRLEHAMHLLASEDSTVEDIMVRSGFSDKSAFYHAFAKKTGLTPKEYRDKNK